MKLLIFGGTFEGRRLAADAVAMGACCTVSVATELGAEELTGICELVVEVGRLEVPAMTELAEKADLCQYPSGLPCSRCAAGPRHPPG